MEKREILKRKKITAEASLLLDILALWLFTFYVLDSQLQTTDVQWPVWYTHRYT